MEERHYVTVLAFAQDVGEVISAGIINQPTRSKSSGASEIRFEVTEASPPKTNFTDIRERRKLGKRILKAVQPLLEAALRVEAEISHKLYENLQKELENIIDASISTSRNIMAPGTAKQEDGQDTIMVDAPDPSEITVRGGLPPAAAEQDMDAEGEDAMDTAGNDADEDSGNIRVNTSGLGVVNVKSEEATSSPRKTKRGKSASLQTSETPPGSEEFVNLAPPSAQTGPPTPPQSNGSFGKEPADPLTDGGVLWYLKSLQPRGTSVLGDDWAAGRDAVRMLSEELTDLDDEELKGLRAEVDESVKAAGLDLNGLSDSDSKAKAVRSKKRRASGRRR